MAGVGMRRIVGGREGVVVMVDGGIVVAEAVIEGEGEAEVGTAGDGRGFNCGFRCWDLIRIALALRRNFNLSNMQTIQNVMILKPEYRNV